MSRYPDDYKFVKYDSSIYDVKTGKNYPNLATSIDCTSVVLNTSYPILTPPRSVRYYIRCVTTQFISNSANTFNGRFGVYGVFEKSSIPLNRIHIKYAALSTNTLRSSTIPRVILDAGTPIFVSYEGNRNFDVDDSLLVYIEYAEVDSE